MSDNTDISDSYVLGPRLDLTAAAALCADLKERRGKPLTIDAANVDHLGSQCLQVLISAAQTWRVDNAKLSYSEQSEAFTEALQSFGAPFEALVTGGEN